MKRITITIEDKDAAALFALNKSSGAPVSLLARKAIAAFLARKSNQPK